MSRAIVVQLDEQSAQAQVDRCDDKISRLQRQVSEQEQARAKWVDVLARLRAGESVILRG